MKTRHFSALGLLLALACPFSSVMATPADDVLTTAIHRDDLELAKKALKNHAKIDGADDRGFLPIHLAAKYASPDMVKLLLDSGAAVSATGKNGEQAIHWAVAYGRVKTVKFLLEHGAKIDAVDNNGIQPVHVAAEGNNLAVMRLLFEKGANLKAEVLNGAHAGGQPIHAAAGGGKTQIVKFLLRNGASLNTKDKLGNTPLMLAEKNDRKDLVAWIQDHATLGNAGLTDTDKELNARLLEKAEDGYKEDIERLLSKGADIDAADKDGLQPIHRAALACNTRTLGALLKAGAREDAEDGNGSQPIHYACCNMRVLRTWESGCDRLKSLKLLMDSGSSGTSANKLGIQPIHLAAGSGFSEAVQLLKAKGASLSVKTNAGETPCMFAEKGGHQELARWITDHEDKK